MSNRAAEQSHSRCELCALEGDRVTVGERVLDSRLVAHVDLDVVVLVGPTARDVLVVPRRHVAMLSMTSVVAAPALSAMRVVVNFLRSALGAAGATIQPTFKTGGAHHLSFRVVPTPTSTQGDVLLLDVEAMVSLVGEALDSARWASRA